MPRVIKPILHPYFKQRLPWSVPRLEAQELFPQIYPKAVSPPKFEFVYLKLSYRACTGDRRDHSDTEKPETSGEETFLKLSPFQRSYGDKAEPMREISQQLTAISCGCSEARKVVKHAQRQIIDFEIQIQISQFIHFFFTQTAVPINARNNEVITNCCK